MRNPPLQHIYAANVALVVLSLFPGLINTSAIGLLSPVIGHDLSVPPDAVARLPLFNDGALAFGVLLAADIVRFINSRRFFFALMVLSMITSLGSALAPNFGVLITMHIVHGLAGGALFIVMLPPLVTGFPGERLRSSAFVLVPSLFGAAALGPIVAALVASPNVWRAIFFTEAGVAVITIGLAVFVLADRPPSSPQSKPDWFAHIVAGCAAICIFIGAGALAGHDWSDLSASIPVMIGIALFIALIVGENFLPHALVPVRGLSTSLALVGIIATMIGSACFAALSQSLTLILLRLDRLDIHQTGLATWPEFFAALVAGAIFGRVILTKWIAVIGVAGLGVTALALAAITWGAVPAPGEVTLLSFVAGLGAGCSVTPGLLLVALTYERYEVGRALAMLNLLRLTGTYITGPLTEHSIGSRTAAYLAFASGRFGAVAQPVREFVVFGRVAPGINLVDLERALGAGIRDTLGSALFLACAGIASIVMLLLSIHRPLITPDIAAFDAGHPALPDAFERAG